MKKIDSQFETPDESPGFLLWRVTIIWQREQREALATIGITHVQFVLLACLCWMQENLKVPVSQALLSAQAKTDLMMTSQVVRALIKKKYMVRKRSKTDTRAYILNATDAGWQVFQKGLKIVEDVDQRFFRILGKDRSPFAKHLQQLLIDYD